MKTGEFLRGTIRNMGVQYKNKIEDVTIKEFVKQYLFKPISSALRNIVYFDKYGLNIKEPVYYGSWSGRKEILSYQDINRATRG